jgi:hypothetical protein
MPSSGILRRVTLARTDVREESIASIIRVTESANYMLLTANGVPISLIFSTLIMEVIFFTETSVLTRKNYCEDQDIDGSTVLSLVKRWLRTRCDGEAVIRLLASKTCSKTIRL